MTVQETNTFLKRIKQYYNDFVVDDFKIEEWYKQLKDYDAEDINVRLDKHLKSETYGDYPPKLNYILAGVLKTKDKEAVRRYDIQCAECGMILDYFSYDDHIRRCNATNYVIREMKKYLNKDITKEQLNSLDETTFWDKYDAMLQIVKSKLPKNSGKRKLIEAYFGEIDLSVEEVNQAVISGYEEEVN